VKVEARGERTWPRSRHSFRRQRFSVIAEYGARTDPGEMPKAGTPIPFFPSDAFEMVSGLRGAILP
jgi:hypothetical protein